MKKCISIFMAAIVLFTMLPINVFAHENTSVECQRALFSAMESNAITVSQSNMHDIISTYDIPVEVAECIAQKLESATSGEIVNVIVPYQTTSESSLAIQSSSGSWSPIRIYDGYELTDWVVTITNGTGMSTITSTAFSNNILAFCGTVATFIGGVLLDTAYAFGSAATTACQFILGLETNSIEPTSGDKLQASPLYTCYDTFTYVQVSGEKHLGAHTYAVNLTGISWYAYSASEHNDSYAKETRNEMYESLNYSRRSAKAVQWFSLGGWSDDPIYITIGDVNFYLY